MKHNLRDICCCEEDDVVVVVVDDEDGCCCFCCCTTVMSAASSTGGNDVEVDDANSGDNDADEGTWTKLFGDREFLLLLKCTLIGLVNEMK